LDQARQRHLARMLTEASELARPVFARAGYRLLHRRDVPIHNCAMEKHLG
jgi:putative acetyltransferase